MLKRRIEGGGGSSLRGEWDDEKFWEKFTSQKRVWKNKEEKTFLPYTNEANFKAFSKKYFSS